VKREVLKREKEEKGCISVVWSEEKLRRERERERERFFMGPTTFFNLLYPAKKGANTHVS